MTFRRFSRRRQLRAFVVALIDRLEWGPPEALADPIVATSDGTCVACGTRIWAEQLIVLAAVGPSDQRRHTFIHWTCPDAWAILASTVEQYDDKIISKINPAGRGRASGCGHDVTDRPVYLVRRPVSLNVAGHSDWFCEACVTPRTVE